MEYINDKYIFYFFDNFFKKILQRKNAFMKACIIGAGPAGLYSAKYLLDKKIPVQIYEKSNKIMGNYNYANSPTSQIDCSNYPISFNCDHTKVNDDECSFYIVATGGIPREFHMNDKCHKYISGLDVVKQHFDNSLNYLGDKVCIIGMGNVTMDILKYIKGKCKDVTVVSRSSLNESAFDNHKIRQVIDSNQYTITTNLEDVNQSDKKDRLIEKSDIYLIKKQNNIQNLKEKDFEEVSDNSNDPQKTPKQISEDGNMTSNSHNNIRTHLINVEERKHLSRAKLFQKIHKNLTNGAMKLRLLFDTEISDVLKVNDRTEITFKGKKYFKDTFDTVIGSIGFIPNKIKIETKKPIYEVGWCRNPRGHITDAKAEANDLVDMICRNKCSNVNNEQTKILN